MKLFPLLALLVIACNENKTAAVTAENAARRTPPADTIVASIRLKSNCIYCDLDGDGLKDTVQIVQHVRSRKSGLRITFGKNGKIDYLGLGKDILNQGFDDIDWAGIFKIAPRGTVYWNNVNEDGEILAASQIKDKNKITLKNDEIFLHAVES